MPTLLRIGGRVFAIAAVLVALSLPIRALALSLPIYNASDYDAWITIQNGPKNVNMAAFRIPAHTRGSWGGFSPTGGYYIRFEFMSGNTKRCDTKAELSEPGRVITVTGVEHDRRCYIDISKGPRTR